MKALVECEISDAGDGEVTIKLAKYCEFTMASCLVRRAPVTSIAEVLWLFDHIDFLDRLVRTTQEQANESVNAKIRALATLNEEVLRLRKEVERLREKEGAQ